MVGLPYQNLRLEILLISTLVDDFLTVIEKEKGMSEHTVRAYKNDLTLFCEWLSENGIFEAIELDSLSHAKIRSYWAKRRNEGLCALSMKRGQSALRGFFKYAMRRKEITKNVAETMESPKTRRGLPKALSENITETFLNAPDKSTLMGLRDRAILETIYGSGLRVSEAADLTYENIDFSNQIARITGKGNKTRLVPMTPSSCGAIKTYLEARNSKMPLFKDVKYIFLNKSGAPLTTRSIGRMINKYTLQSALMLHVTPHQFRHSFATHLLNNGADIRAVQEMLGHANLSTTQIYTQISKEKLMQTYQLCHPRSGHKDL